MMEGFEESGDPASQHRSSSAELDDRPNFPRSKICYSWHSGGRDRGNACRYDNHDSGVSVIKSGGGGNMVRPVCFSYRKTGICDRIKCSYLHTDTDAGLHSSSTTSTGINNVGSNRQISSSNIHQPPPPPPELPTNNSGRSVVGVLGGLGNNMNNGGGSLGGNNNISGNTGMGGRRGLCYAWQQGKCYRGDSCRFSHDDSANICFTYRENGACEREELCRYRHE